MDLSPPFNPPFKPRCNASLPSDAPAVVAPEKLALSAFVSLRQAARILAVDGKPADMLSMRRYINIGVAVRQARTDGKPKRIRLRTTQVGGRIVTTRGWINEWQAALTQATGRGEHASPNESRRGMRKQLAELARRDAEGNPMTLEEIRQFKFTADQYPPVSKRGGKRARKGRSERGREGGLERGGSGGHLANGRIGAEPTAHSQMT